MTNKLIYYLLILITALPLQSFANKKDNTNYPILVLSENAGQHKPFTDAAMKWLSEEGFNTTVIFNTEKIDSAYLSQFKVFLQLDYPPYNWTDKAKCAFEKAIFNGTIGWVGFHHATLLGDFDGFPMWQWFSDFMGDIKFNNYISDLADGKIVVENNNHPVMRGVNPSFIIENDEWYTFNKSPRHDGIGVLAHVDEDSYTPTSDIKMGDHPAVWTNNRMKARNVYFLFGHHPSLFLSTDFTTMLRNALNWASTEPNSFPRFRILAYANPEVEPAHRQFADDAIKFLSDMTIGDGIDLDIITDADDITQERLRTYQLFVCLNDNPGHTEAQRNAFRHYMENGGSWLGIHAAGYNDASTNWSWYLDFLGGGVFHRNNWTPQPGKLLVDNPSHPVAKCLPQSFISPSNEWYQWSPSPRQNPKVEVLLTLSPENYPIGFKDIIPDGDTPVVWTNTDYNMLYINMGHGDRIFSDATQNLLFFNAIRWLMREHLPQ